MTISLDDLNRVTMRQMVPWFRDQMNSVGANLPTDWNPSDEELERLAMALAEVNKAWDQDEDETC